MYPFINTQYSGKVVSNPMRLVHIKKKTNKKRHKPDDSNSLACVHRRVQQNKTSNIKDSSRSVQ